MESIKEEIKNYFAKQNDIEHVYLFGSAATGRNRKHSDVDIAVLFDRDFPKEEYTQRALSIMDRLSRILNRDIDVVVLNKASCFLRFQIIKNGISICERPGRKKHNFEAETIVEYLDFLPIRKRLETAMINNIKGI